MEPIKDHDEARRMARVIISDIVAYNLEKVMQGIAHDNLFEVLGDELKEGEIYYRSVVDKELCDTHNFYNLAIVDLLIKPRDYVQSEIW